MKKVLSVILVLAMVLGLSLYAFADDVNSAVGPEADPWKTSSKPSYIGHIEVTPIVDMGELTEEQQQTFADGYKDLPNVVPEYKLVQYFVYVESDEFPVQVDFEISNVTDVSAKLYYDGEWEDLEVVDNGDGTVTITIPHEGALAIFNGNASWFKLTPMERKKEINKNGRTNFIEAHDELEEQCPEGMHTAYYKYAESNAFPVSVRLMIGEFDEFEIRYCIDGKWVELDGFDNKDGTITLTIPCEGSLAIFTNNRDN